MRALALVLGGTDPRVPTEEPRNTRVISYQPISGNNGGDGYGASSSGGADRTAHRRWPRCTRGAATAPPDALADLAGRLDGYGHTALAAPDGRGIRVGFLSRLALT